MADDEMTALHDAARELGVQAAYWDVHGAHHEATPDQLRAVVSVLVGATDPSGWRDAYEAHTVASAERPCAPVLVRPMGEAVDVELRLASGVTAVALVLVAEDGVTVDRRAVDLSSDALTLGFRSGLRTWRITLEDAWFAPAGIGRHTLVVEHGDDRCETTVLCTPGRVARLADEARLWGIFAPLYSLWSPTRPDPTLGHLARLAERVDSLGGKVVATLPLLAGFLDRPYEPSPYTPISRCWWNEAYLDLAARPEVRECAPASALVEQHRPSGAPTDAFDAQKRAAHVRAVLATLVETLRTGGGGGLRAELERFCGDRPDVLDYARFRGEVERTGTGWHGWAGDPRPGQLDSSLDDDAVLAHVYAQWAMLRQLASLNKGLAQRDQFLYLDLPVGVHGDGYDTWRHRELFAWGVAAGAPPDEFFTAGQNWGFPPLSPWASRLDGHRHFAACLRSHMEVCGLLRLDHVMALHRLFWVPDGAGAAEGVYVHYPAEELFAVLAIESHRNRCAVVGEDLGTVPDEVREMMGAHGLTGMYVAEFSQPAHPDAPLATPHGDVVASIGTHDTPTFVGWLRGDDIDRRRDMGLLDATEAAAEHGSRGAQVANLRRDLAARGWLDDAGEATDEHAIFVALTRLLAASEVPVVLTSIDDLTGQSDPQNVPGTPVDRPNWVLRADRSLAEFESDAALTQVLEQVQAERLGAWERARR